MPSIVLHDLHETNVAVGALIVFEYGAIAATLIVLGRRLRPVAAMSAGLLALLPAVALIVTAQATRSLPLLLVATAFGAMTAALGFRGSLEIVNDLAPDERRAEVVSAYYLVCFVGNAIPVIGIGIVSTVADPFVASVVFAATLASLSLTALAWRRAAAARSGTGLRPPPSGPVHRVSGR